MKKILLLLAIIFIITDAQASRYRGLPVEKNKTELHIAVEEGNLEKVKKLIADGVNINAVTNQCNTPLLTAEKSRSSDRFEIIKLLLDKGADSSKKDKQGRTIVDLALRSTDRSLSEFFEERNIKKSNQSRNATDCGARSIMECNIMKGNLKIVKELLESGYCIEQVGTSNNNALHWAIKYHKNDILRYLIKMGADIEAKGLHNTTPPIFFAAKDKNAEALEILLELGANPNGEITWGGKQKVNILQLSIANRSSGTFRGLDKIRVIDIIKVLQKHGIKPDLESIGATILHEAAIAKGGKKLAMQNILHYIGQHMQEILKQ